MMTVTLSTMPAYHEDTVRPPISCGTMSLAVDDFRRHVLHRPTERKRLLLVKYRLFAETKVGQFYVTVSIKQDAATIHVYPHHLHNDGMYKL